MKRFTLPALALLGLATLSLARPAAAQYTPTPTHYDSFSLTATGTSQATITTQSLRGTVTTGDPDANFAPGDPVVVNLKISSDKNTSTGTLDMIAVSYDGDTDDYINASLILSKPHLVGGTDYQATGVFGGQGSDDYADTFVIGTVLVDWPNGLGTAKSPQPFTLTIGPGAVTYNSNGNVSGAKGKYSVTVDAAYYPGYNQSYQGDIGTGDGSITLPSLSNGGYINNLFKNFVVDDLAYNDQLQFGPNNTIIGQFREGSSTLPFLQYQGLLAVMGTGTKAEQIPLTFVFKGFYLITDGFTGVGTITSDPNLFTGGMDGIFLGSIYPQNFGVAVVK